VRYIILEKAQLFFRYNNRKNPWCAYGGWKTAGIGSTACPPQVWYHSSRSQRRVGLAGKLQRLRNAAFPPQVWY